MKKKWNFESNDYEIDSDLMSPGLKAKKLKVTSTILREVEDHSYIDNYYAHTNQKKKEDTLEPIQDYSSNSEYETEYKSNILS